MNGDKINTVKAWLKTISGPLSHERRRYFMREPDIVAHNDIRVTKEAKYENL